MIKGIFTGDFENDKNSKTKREKTGKSYTNEKTGKRKKRTPFSSTKSFGLIIKKEVSLYSTMFNCVWRIIKTLSVMH